MLFKSLSVRGASLALTLILAAAPSSLLAASQDYRVELAGTPQPAAGGKSIVSVRLMRTKDGKPVTDAVVFEAKADMGPASMAAMTAPVRPIPAKDGLYRFEVEPSMAGLWALNLAAKVQGETETVRGSVVADLAK